MKTLEESIMEAMDCSDPGILPFLPYILQDFWTIGTNPEVIVHLIAKHGKGKSSTKVLDLGCGKGAASIKIAEAFRCHCHGIDGMADFITSAASRAGACNVGDCCRFEHGDIRKMLKDLGLYDVIVLGAVGRVLGSWYETLTLLSSNLGDEGLILIDDGYVEDECNLEHPHVYKKSEVLKQIDAANMMMIDQVFVDDTSAADYQMEYERLSRRCNELSEKHPERAALFQRYKAEQKKEYALMQSDIICSTMVIKHKSEI